MASKTYKTYIDCRILGEEIKFIFLISNVPGNTTSKSYNKKKCITITYNTNNLVEAICMYQGDNERLFLRFSSAHLKIENNYDFIIDCTNSTFDNNLGKDYNYILNI